MSEEHYAWQVGDVSIELRHDEITDRFEDYFEQEKCNAVLIGSFWHRTSILSTINIFQCSEAMKEFAQQNSEYELFRLFRYEHGLVMFSAVPLDEQPSYPFNCQWDAGLEGMILAKAVEGKDAQEVANDWLTEISNFCNGEVYGYILKNEDGEEIDSCWGFLGYEHAKQSAIEAAYVHIEDPTEVREICEH